MQQSAGMYVLQKQQLQYTYTDTTSAAYKDALHLITDQYQRDHYKYYGEGIIFLLLIIIGSVYIYRSVRRQLSLQQQQQNFVMAVTHELKTPISVARLNLETIKRYRLDAVKQEKLIDISLQETLRLDMLINNILISSQLDGNAYHPLKETLDLSQLAGTEIKAFSNRYPDRPIEAQLQPNLSLQGDELLLKLLISNLLENANKYSPKNKPITCSLQAKNNALVLQVKDQGLGISDDEKEKVFQKFYRIGNEQTRTAKGTGLGLFISQKIAAAHSATIHITDVVPQGSNFTVSFPV